MISLKEYLKQLIDDERLQLCPFCDSDLEYPTEDYTCGICWGKYNLDDVYNPIVEELNPREAWVQVGTAIHEEAFRIRELDGIVEGELLKGDLYPLDESDEGK